MGDKDVSAVCAEACGDMEIEWFSNCKHEGVLELYSRVARSLNNAPIAELRRAASSSAA